MDSTGKKVKLDKTKLNRALVSWRSWLFLFLPLGAVTALAVAWFGFRYVFPVTLVVLAITLLHQKFIRKRSWNSIIWGARDPLE